MAITFVYTRCPFPNFCFRFTNNFAQMQKRFAVEMGRDLLLLPRQNLVNLAQHKYGAATRTLGSIGGYCSHHGVTNPALILVPRLSSQFNAAKQGEPK